MMIRTVFIPDDQGPTPEQIAQVRAAAKRPITFDEDCPPITPETYASILRATAEHDARKREAARRTAQG